MAAEVAVPHGRDGRAEIIRIERCRGYPGLGRPRTRDWIQFQGIRDRNDGRVCDMHGGVGFARNTRGDPVEETARLGVIGSIETANRVNGRGTAIGFVQSPISYWIVRHDYFR